MIAQNSQVLETQIEYEEHNIIKEQSKMLIKETSKGKEEHKIISQRAQILDQEVVNPVTHHHVS